MAVKLYGSNIDLWPESNLPYANATPVGGTDPFPSRTVQGPIPSFIPGDANRDGKIDMADYTAWFNNYGVGTLWEQGNFKGAGVTDMADYCDWFNRYGGGCSFSQSVVPEPFTLALFGTGLLYLLSRRGTKENIDK